MSCYIKNSVINHYDKDWSLRNAQINRQIRRVSECGKCTVRTPILFRKKLLIMELLKGIRYAILPSIALWALIILLIKIGMTLL